MEAQSINPTTTGPRYTLAVDVDPRHLAAARSFVAAVAAEAGYDHEVIADLKLAVSEACTNAIKAQASIEVSDQILVTAVVVDGRLSVEVDDAGGGFDVTPQAWALPTATEPSQLARGGLGLGVIRALFPDASILPNERGGTRLTLTLAARSEEHV